MRSLPKFIALLLPFVVAAPADAQPALQGTFILTSAGSDNVAAVIDAAVARVNITSRAVVRGWLRRTNEPYRHIVIAVAGGHVSMTFDQRRPLVTPADGAPVDWMREDGEKLKVATRLDDGRIIQTFDAEDGKRVNVYSLSPDGRALTLGVTVTAPRLPRPMTYKLVYNRAS
jgi:hypothetical protein